MVIVPVVALLLYFIARHRRDLLEGRVVILEGDVLRRADSSGEGATTYYYSLGNQEFRVSWAAYEALIPGERYRLVLPAT